eukprot:TRINITY_DN80150_c0_g1_i1.p1 TRINITY_DN80150_c0_g1~~TRINITY_DN80150_c0_g1_i1.p1  ORF type:complete len:194 (-),score=10.14 TRINITY_DN80150_c0_g1_i1:52-579(-)
MADVRVVVDEWVVTTDPERILCTDGLAGCVGIAIRTTDKAFLTHVYSDLDPTKNWDAYKGQLDVALGNLNPDDIKDCILVGACHNTPDRARIDKLEDYITQWIDRLEFEGGPPISPSRDFSNKCRISVNKGIKHEAGVSVITATAAAKEKPEQFITGYLSKTGEELAKSNEQRDP